MHSVETKTYVCQALALALLIGAASVAMYTITHRDVVMVKVDGVMRESPVVARGAACHGKAAEQRSLLETSPVRNSSYPL